MSNKSTSSAVATQALAYCTSCKMDLNSIIVAMKADRIAKVQCLTCKKEHAYKAPKGIDSPEKKPTKRASKKKEAQEAATAQSIEMEWEKLMNQNKEAPIKGYSLQAHFVLGDKIKHPTFGDGIVGRLIYPNKIEVLFRNDLIILIYAGSRQA